MAKRMGGSRGARARFSEQRGIPQSSPADPGYPMPTRAPSYRSDFTPEQRQHIESQVASAGEEAFGHPITMEDAVNTRVNAVRSAIANSRGGKVPGIDWYLGHQGSNARISEETGIRTGAVIDAGALLSPRNRPSQELMASRSAAFIAGNPHQKVNITPEMAPHIGTMQKSGGKWVTTPSGKEGVVTLGSLTALEAASLGPADVAASKITGFDRSIQPEIADVSLKSAGRLRGELAVQATRGTPLDKLVKEGPKIKHYARSSHEASPEEVAYNEEVIHRMESPEIQKGQGTLWSAAELSNFNPHRDSPTAEDYIMMTQSATVAAEKGGKGVPAREAQNVLNVKKTRTVPTESGTKTEKLFPANIGAEEIRHAFDVEATRRAAEQIGYVGHTPSGPTYEHITPVGVQSISWVQTQRNLGEDIEYNKAMKEQEKQAKEAEKARQKKEAAQRVMNGTQLSFLDL